MKTEYTEPRGNLKLVVVDGPHQITIGMSFSALRLGFQTTEPKPQNEVYKSWLVAIQKAINNIEKRPGTTPLRVFVILRKAAEEAQNIDSFIAALGQ